MRVAIGTGNAGKRAELAQSLPEFGFEIAHVSEQAPLQEPAEVGESFIENALIKACAYRDHWQLSCLADDSGLVVPVLDGEPGVRSKRWLDAEGDFDMARKQLLARMTEYRGEQRRAYLVCALCIATSSRQTLVAEFRCAGSIVDAANAASGKGIGYEPLFCPKGFAQTFAQLQPSLRLAAHPRTHALQQLAAIANKF